MTQVDIQIDDAFLRSLHSDVQLAPGDIKRIRRRASWETAKQGKTDTSRRVREKVNLKKKDLDPHIVANRSGDGAILKVAESRRLPLRDFGARQTRKGVTHKISKEGKRRLVPGAFIAGSMGGHAFKRWGKERLPIGKLYAISTWGVVVKNEMPPEMAETAENNLYKNLVRGVRYEVLKKTGQVK